MACLQASKAGMRTVKQALTEGYRDDEFCIGAMSAGVELFAENADAQRLRGVFASAAHARGASVSDAVRLLESDPEAVGSAAWPQARALLLSSEVLPDTEITALRRLTAAMNGREVDPQGGADIAEPMPYSDEFVLAVLDYSHGDATERQTLAAIGSEDPAVLCMYAYQLSDAARKIGMDDERLARLRKSLGVSGTVSASALNIN